MMSKITKMGTMMNKAWSFTKDKTTVVKDSVVKVCSDAKESFLVGFNGIEGQGTICDYLEESNSEVLSNHEENGYHMLNCRTADDRYFTIFAYADTWYIVEA